MSEDNKNITINRQNNDLVLKRSTDKLWKTILMFLGVVDENEIIEEKDNDIALAKSFNTPVGRVFQVNDDVLLNLEFETSPHEGDFPRYLMASACLSYDYASKFDFEKAFSVRMVVAYPYKVKIPSNLCLDRGSLLFSVNTVSLGDLVDSDKFLLEMKEMLGKSESNPNFVLSEEDVMKIILAPMGRIKGSRRRFFQEFEPLKSSLLKNTDLIDENFAFSVRSS
jgi:hypothetical protein